MTNFYIIGDKWLNANTAEYGFGDHPKRITCIMSMVQADTARSAMSAAKKRNKNFIFSGINANRVCTAEQLSEMGMADKVQFYNKIYGIEA